MLKPNVLEQIRHSAEHLLTYAVVKQWGTGKIKPVLGPAIEDGFYFDFDKPEDLIISDKDFPKWEKEMKKVIKANWTFKRLELSLEVAARFFSSNEYKLEIINDLAQEAADGKLALTVYSLAPKEKNEVLTAAKVAGMTFEEAWEAGYYIELCKGPHVERAGEIGAVRLLRVASAYWRGDEKNKQLTRIYGTAFATEAELEDYLNWLEETKKRDHKRIGRQQDLFSFHPESPGAVFWHEKGMIVWDILEKLGQDIKKKYGYVKIKTPEMAKSTLWKTSGHWDHYREDMFVFQADEEDYCMKPMDCPFNIKIYQTRQRSYRDLPMRFTEIGHVFRNEKSGELNGLFRVREITQDDSHLLVREDQVLTEVGNLLEMVKEYYAKLGVAPAYFLSTRPDDFMGEIEAWNKAEADLIEALVKKDIKYGLKEKDGAFYGPKIDVNIKDALGRSWQVATIQLDFQLPGRFGCEYIGKDGQKKVPVMIHAAIFGSYERMIGILLEHYAGRLPMWLAPVQVKVLPITDEQRDYGMKVRATLEETGVRVAVDERSERLPAKIRDAQLEQIPVMLIVGEKEVKEETVSLRLREGGKEKTVRLAEVRKLLA